MFSFFVTATVPGGIKLGTDVAPNRALLRARDQRGHGCVAFVGHRAVCALDEPLRPVQYDFVPASCGVAGQPG